jgi:histidinol phosphatase-like PHP family hydrolase
MVLLHGIELNIAPDGTVDWPAGFLGGFDLCVASVHPNRLDLPSAHIKAAKDAGVKFAIDSDAHFTGGLDYRRYGVGTAQRGWLTPADVINTWPLPRLREFLRKAR